MFRPGIFYKQLSYRKVKYFASITRTILTSSTLKMPKENVMNIPTYTHAVVREIPDSYVSGAVGATEKICIDKARRQHANYVKSLREAGLEVLVLPADENHPDCLFVEDTAVVCNGRALLTKPGHSTRRNEIIYMKSVLETQMGLPVKEIEDPTATLDGGDVLFTGKEFFIGQSTRTNAAGAAAVAEAFPEFPVTPVKVGGTLHLKCLVTMAGPGVMCCSSYKPSQEAIKRLEAAANFKYQVLQVPDRWASNCVFINGNLLHRADYPNSNRVFCEKMLHYNLKPQSWSEIEKGVGSLSCCSILIRKPELTPEE